MRSQGNARRSNSRHHERLADRLVELFLARGFLEMTLDQLAAELQCSKTTLYRLGNSREQIIRAVIVRFFEVAARRIEAQLVTCEGPRETITVYLLAVAQELKPASASFMNDVSRFRPAREVYERNTRIAGRRIEELIAQGVAEGIFRNVNAAFVADVVTSTMGRIQDRSLTRVTGLDDSSAYLELLSLISRGILC